MQLNAEQLNVKLAVGAWFAGLTATLRENGALLVPWLSVTVNVTVYVPAAV